MTSPRRSGPILALGMLLVLSAVCPGADDLVQARRLDRSGDHRAAAVRYEALLRAHPDHPDAEDVALRLAEIMYEKDGPTARLWYRRFVDRYGYADRDGWGRYGLAVCLIARGQLDEAARILGNVVETAEAGSPVLPLARLRLAWVRLVAGETGPAMKTFRRLETVFGDTRVGQAARLGQAVAYLLRGEPAKALKTAGALDVATAPPDLRRRARLAAALALPRLKRPDEALPKFLSLLSPPGSTVGGAALYAYCGLLASGGRPRKANAALTAWMRTCGPDRADLVASLLTVGNGIARQRSTPPLSPAMQTALALWRLKQGDWRDARRRLLRADEADPSGPWGPFRLYAAGLCAERLGNRTQAKSLLTRASDLAERNSPLARSADLARLRCVAKDTTASASPDSKALGGDADDLLRLARLEVLTGRAAAAARRIEGLVDSLPAGGAARRQAALWRGRALLLAGRPGQAAAELRAWLRAHPGDRFAAAARLDRAEALCRTGRLTRARLELEGAPARDAPAAVRGRRAFLLGHITEKQGGFRDALRLYDAALSLAKTSRQRNAVQTRRAACLHALGRDNDCVAALAATPRDAPPRLPARTLLWAAITADRLRAHRQALTFSEALLERGDDAPSAMAPEADRLRARSLALLGRWEECARAADEALRRRPRSPFRRQIALDRAEALLRTGRPKEADAWVLREGLADSLRGGWVRAEALAAQGRKADSLRAWRRLLVLHGDALRGDWAFLVHAGHGRSLLATGERAEARKAFAAALRAVTTSTRCDALQHKLRGETRDLLRGNR